MEEMNKEDLERLCKMYGFSHEILGNYIQIKSEVNTYYILNREHEWRTIELRHQNSLGNARTHTHGQHRDLQSIFWSIQTHEDRFTFIKKIHKTTRMERLFNIIHAQSC